MRFKLTLSIFGWAVVGLGSMWLTLSPRAMVQSPAPLKSSTKGDVPTYAKNIRPILTTQCVGCHNRNVIQNVAISGGLALENFESLKAGTLTKEGIRRPVLATGKPESSEFYLRLIEKESAKRMPKGGEPLTPKQLDLIKKWIIAGTPPGDLKAARTDSSEVILPAQPPVSVHFITNIVATADMLPNPPPKDTRISLDLLAGPLSPVTAAAFQPNSHKLAIGNYRGVFIWDLDTATVVKMLAEPTGAVQSLFWSVDGKRLAVGGGLAGANGEVLIYDAEQNYKLLQTLSGHTDVVYSAVFSPDGTKIATASQDKTVRTWDVATGKQLNLIKAHSDVVFRVRFAKDGQSIFTCSNDKSIRQFETATGKPIKTFDGHQQGVLALAVHPNGTQIVSSGSENRISWWNVSDAARPRYSDGSGVQVNDIVFSPDGKYMAAATGGKAIHIWDGASSGLVQSFYGAPDWFYSVSISSDNVFVAAGCGDGGVRIYRLNPASQRCVLIAARNLTSKSEAYEWLAITEPGYFSASTGWDKKLSVSLSGELAAKRTLEVLSILRKPENIFPYIKGDKINSPSIPVLPKPNSKAPEAAKKP